MRFQSVFWFTIWIWYKILYCCYFVLNIWSRNFVFISVFRLFGCYIANWFIRYVSFFIHFNNWFLLWMKKRSSWLRLIIKFLMPQFDIFSFFSQLFWVFFGFILLYLALTFYLLPALATTLKVRKRKLAQMDVNSNSSVLANDSSLLIDSTISFISNYNTKIRSIDSNSLGLNLIKLELNLLALKAEAFRYFNFSIISKTQLTTIFFN